ncbi:MAG: hypothetical protein P1V36_15740, partial [Planctomycetota bacterium]|nr:hypothetical protein [Planctomycetota bacterium]
MTRVLPPLGLLALLLAFVAPPAHGADGLTDLVRDYEAAVPQPDQRSEAGYQAQEDALEAIAVRQTADARSARRR